MDILIPLNKNFLIYGYTNTLNKILQFRDMLVCWSTIYKLVSLFDKYFTHIKDTRTGHKAGFTRLSHKGGFH